MAGRVELVDVQTEDGLLHTGAWQEPTGPRPPGPVDAVLLMHGSAMNFYHPFLRSLADGLAAAGYPTLAANNRGHDLVSRPVGPREEVARLASIPERPEPLYGTSYEDLPDLFLDWQAWIGFLAERGFRRLCLFGHSRGAVKTAAYMARRRDPRVVATVLCSPPRFSYRDWLASARRDLFLADLQAAESLVSQGRGDELFGAHIPMDYPVRAAAYLEQYGPEERYDVLRLAREVPGPLLVVYGTTEVEQRFAFAGLPEAFSALARERPGLRCVTIPGADHLYTGQLQALCFEIVSWLSHLA